MNQRDAAHALGIAEATVSTWIKRLGITPKRRRDGGVYLTPAQVETIRQARAANNYATGTSRGMTRYYKARREREEEERNYG